MTLRRIIWLASYPKCGNTWTRYFLANYFLPKDQVPDINNIRRFTTADVRQDFFDRAAGRPFAAESFEEWLAVRGKALRLIAASRPGTHFVKTHSQVGKIGGDDLIPPELTAAAVVILRNPFDVVISYARHLSLGIDETIDQMLDAKAMNASPTRIMEVIGRWDDHVRSWTEAHGLPRHVMRYEDMSADPERAFRGLLGFLKVPVRDGQLRRAIRAASFESMKKQEEAKGFIERPKHMKSFFAKGKAGAWRDDLSPAQVARLRTPFLPLIERHWPELLDETAEIAGAA